MGTYTYTKKIIINGLTMLAEEREPSAGGSDLGDTDTRGPPHRESLSGVTERFYIDLPKRESAVSAILVEISTTS